MYLVVTRAIIYGANTTVRDDVLPSKKGCFEVDDTYNMLLLELLRYISSIHRSIDRSITCLSTMLSMYLSCRSHTNTASK